jgi:hypothetical protein
MSAEKFCRACWRWRPAAGFTKTASGHQVCANHDPDSIVKTATRGGAFKRKHVEKAKTNNSRRLHGDELASALAASLKGVE